MLIDSNAHLVSLENISEVLQRAKENNITKIVSISSDIPSTEATISLAEQYDFIFATTGVHPHSAEQTNEEVLKGLDHYATHEKVVAIGETGLDYFYMNSEKEIQINSFTEHIRLGKKHNLPIIIHVRDADEDMQKILKKETAYIGLIGSRRRVSFVLEILEKKGFPKMSLQAVFTTIGTPIGGESPGEIAFSIAAELVCVHRKGPHQARLLRAAVGIDP